MGRYRYFIFNQRSVVVLGILQVACAALCVVCGVMDAVFRKNTSLSTTRAPVWAGLIMGSPGVLALFASQRKNPVLVSVMIFASVFSCVAVVIVSAYAGLTLTYGEDDEEVFHHHHIQEVTFVLGRIVRGANATMLLACAVSLLLSSLIAYVGCRSLPLCGCYDSTTGLEVLVPQSDPYPGTELVCTWQVPAQSSSPLPSAAGDDRVFNSPAAFSDRDPAEEEEPSKLPPYSRLT